LAGSFTLETVPDASNAGQPASTRGGFRAVITDWGGVMTNPIADAVRAWLQAEDIDAEHYAAMMRPWVVAAYDPAADGNPIHALERGECTVEEFERLLAARIIRRDGRSVLAEGLLGRMFAATTPCDPMFAAVYALRKAGLRTGLLSNSWGVGDYPRHLFPGMFDAVVISAEVGMRKPEPRIFRHAAGLLGLEPGECVFIDDVDANDPVATVARLSELLGVVLGESR
jgi:putative hydrolase of the HAD superfamily